MHKNPQKIVVFEERKTTEEEMGKRRKKKTKIFVRNFFFVFVKINDRDKAGKKNSICFSDYI